METVDITIIGAGVVGLSVASELGKEGRDIFLLEKNRSWGQETSSRNSEVIHAGIYYQPGSVKATACVEGREMLYKLCRSNNIPFKKIGKLIVASEETELASLQELYTKATIRIWLPVEVGPSSPDRRLSWGWLVEKHNARPGDGD